MLIPYTTDASLRNFPWATIGLIAVNAVVFFATGMGDEAGIIAFGVEYGNGLHPLQWVTSIFMHAHLGHLIGNMLFLWIFGMIIEGKLGWRNFLALYLGLGIGGTALEQSMLFWFDHGRAIGASGVIFSLLGICLIWAPETEIECHWISGGYFGYVRWGEIQITVLWMAIVYIGLNALAAWRYDFRPTSATAHTLGAAIGVALGVAALKRGWVDCDGWDMFSTMSGSYLRRNAARRVHAAGPTVLDASRGDAASSAIAAGFIEQQTAGDQNAAPRNGHSALSDYDNAVKSSPSGVWHQAAKRKPSLR